MQRLAEFVRHARECSALAGKTANEDHRRMLLEMSKTWVALAVERARMAGIPFSPDDVMKANPAKTRALQPAGLPPAPPRKIRQLS